MGALCTNQPIVLPAYKDTITGTSIPAFVSAGGKELYEQARELNELSVNVATYLNFMAILCTINCLTNRQYIWA